jgi:hypothetical protein
MTTDPSDLDYEPGVLRVLQSKEENRHFYKKIARGTDNRIEHMWVPVEIVLGLKENA